MSTATGRVLVVSVGRVDDLPYRNTSVRSAFVKAPVDGAVLATPLGLVGDEQGDRRKHGGPDKALCVFPAEHYAEYQRRLGRALERPAFGENLTTEGLTEGGVCIGDVLTVGSATCEVSLPRNPCFRLAARHGPKEMVLWFEETGFTGFYLRVLEAGAVGAGCPVRLVERRYPHATIAEANRVMHRDKTDRSAVERLLDTPLGESWRRTLQGRLAGRTEDAARRRYGPLGEAEAVRGGGG
ncbi:MOSC domain-containing protein [Actinomadura hibisca]|uniref:MOSC domain-containing protein n=1 Tax=Actinomadura hibisca TaxID=68565 RepID=UPI00082BB284|nr:MOSC domain-containing protein [Actinomadura hibisca]